METRTQMKMDLNNLDASLTLNDINPVEDIDYFLGETKPNEAKNAHENNTALNRSNGNRRVPIYERTFKKLKSQSSRHIRTLSGGLMSKKFNISSRDSFSSLSQDKSKKDDDGLILSLFKIPRRRSSGIATAAAAAFTSTEDDQEHTDCETILTETETILFTPKLEEEHTPVHFRDERFSNENSASLEKKEESIKSITSLAPQDSETSYLSPSSEMLSHGMSRLMRPPIDLQLPSLAPKLSISERKSSSKPHIHTLLKTCPDLPTLSNSLPNGGNHHSFSLAPRFPSLSSSQFLTE